MTKFTDQMNKYRMSYDIHTHTTFSHGKGSIEDNVIVALEKGLKTIGIADHGPGHVTYGVKPSDFPVMRVEIDRLRVKYPQIQILLGVEANIINFSGKLDIKKEEWEDFDYVLAGYHYGIFGERPFFAMKTHAVNFWASHTNKKHDTTQKRINTDLVIKALYENQIKVLTHPGDKGQFDLLPIAEACSRNNTLMEISTWHEAPLTEEIKQLAKSQVSFIISSDAHTPERVGTFVPGLVRALEAGLDPCRIDNLEEL